MNNASIAPLLWTKYAELRERRRALDEVLVELQREIEANPALLVWPALVERRNSLDGAFPANPLDVSVAVIGVFRGGKSTLLNALLGASLLPAAHAATTATITKIRYRADGFVARVSFIGAADESFVNASEDLKRILEKPLDQALSTLTCKSSERDAVESLLGMHLALGEHSAPNEARIAELHAYFKKEKSLPPLLHQRLLGQEIEHAKDDLSSLEQVVRPYVMFTGADGVFDPKAAALQFMIRTVTIEGPFEVLSCPEGSGGSLTLVDTPGLEDPRPFVKKMVHEFLRTADCVCLNVANHANISAADVEVLRALFTGTLHRKLIVTLGKIDQLGADERDLVQHADRQRRMLAAKILELHPGDVAAVKTFLDGTHIIPVAALAALARSKHARGVPLDKLSGRLVEDYPDAASDGTANVYEKIRETLDGSARLTSVVLRAEQSLESVVSAADAAVQAGIDDRNLSASQLQKRAEALAAAAVRANASMKGVLDSALETAEDQWRERRTQLRGRFKAQLSEIALKQLSIARAFVAAATSSEWRHWRRLKAVADRGTFEGGHDSALRDDIALHALGGVPVLLQASIRAILATCTESAENAASLADDASRAFADSMGSLGMADLADVERSLKAVSGAELKKGLAEYRHQMDSLATAFFEQTAQDTIADAATGIVEDWIDAVDGDAGKGVQARMHHALDEALLTFVTRLPEEVEELFGSGLDELFAAAESGAVDVHRRLAEAARTHLADRVTQLEEATTRARTIEASQLDLERRLLAALQTRLRGGS